MARKLEVVDLPLVGAGEQSAAATGEFGHGEAWRLENGIIVGRGIVAQVADWWLGGTCRNGPGTAGTGTENNAVCGIFPFAQSGNLSPHISGGVAFSFNAVDQKIYLHHLREDAVIIRTTDTSAALGTWTSGHPPQITGFEMQGRFYFCWDGREVAGSRKGLAYYNPTANTIVPITAALDGAASDNLRFRGISLHQGGTILGWGYGDGTTADAPHQIRYNKYTDPGTWVAAATDGDITAGKFPVGTNGVPIIGCAQSGRYTIIGKEREIFALDGNFSSQFNLLPIGNAHGPCSGTSMVSIGHAAVWISEDGPAISENGGSVQQLGIDRLLRRWLTYTDLTWVHGVHDTIRNRVGWVMKRQSDYDGVPLARAWADEILWWDYQRDEFYIENSPSNPVFCIGIVKGPGQTVEGPTGAPSALAASAITTASATITWTNGESASGTSTKLEYKRSADSTWTTASSTIGAGVTSYSLTGLFALTQYDVRLTHYKAAIASSTTTSATLFTTASASVVGTPSNLLVAGA